MSTEQEQIEALYNGKRAFLEKYGSGDYTQDLKLFTVPFSKYYAYCKEHGLNSKAISTKVETFDNCYFVQSGEKWLVYYQERGCKYELQEFTDYEKAFEAAVDLTLWDVKLSKI